MSVILVKSGARFDRIDPAGFRLLGALDRVSRTFPVDLTITCGSDAHPVNDPHSLGKAYDIRTHDLTPDQKQLLLRSVLLDLQDGDHDAPLEVSGGLATTHFFGWIEHPGEVTEHCHIQQRRGTTFP